MSYTAKVFYVLESDPTYTLKYDSLNAQISIGNSFIVSFSDFYYNGTHYYVKYAINNGSVYKRDANTIYCKSMMISDDYRYMSWYVFCTENEADITGDCAVSYTDIAKELYLSISTGNSDSVSTRGKETLISVSISQGCVSDSFASYGSTYSPTMSCEMYAENNDFTDAIIAKTYYDNTVKGTIVNAWILIGNEFAYPIPIGRFVVKENPTYNGDTVSFNGNGLMSEYMDRAEISISSLNEYHEEELKKKYVETGKLDFIYTRDDAYFWEYLPQDFLRVTGCPLYIDNWDSILSAIDNYGLQQLMIPMLSDASYDENNGYDISWETRITWRDFLSGIAVILRANVIEKNGAFYIKQLPQLQTSGTYRPIFDGNSYDSSAIFGNNLMCPNNISVKANNWYFYKPNNTVVGFGYYEGESTVVLNDKVSDVSNVENYPVTIESPWILYETLNRVGNQYNWFGRNSPMQWKDGLQFLNKAFVYHKASIETMYWHPLMSVGEMLTFEDYDGVKKYVLVGEMTLRYDGGFYAEITSPCEVQESNSSSVGSSGSNSYNSGTMAQASGTAMGTMLGAIFKDGVITNSKIADSTITGSKIAESTIDNSKIKDSTITGSKFEDGTIENSKIKDYTLTGAKIADATNGFEKVNTSFIKDLTADKAYIDNLTARIGDFGFITADSADLKYATITSLQAVDGKIDTLTAKAITTDNLEAEVATLGYLSAESADVKFATIESLTAVDGKIDTLSSKAITTENLSAKVADLGYLSADSAEISYAKIDFSNVGTQVVSSSMIIDGAVTNEKVANLSANKITSGTIDASKITVTNLNADNLTVGTINGKLIGNGSVDLDKLSQEVPTKEYLDKVQEDLQGQIDGAIETFTKSEIPTLNNEPANAWTDNETRKKHIGDVCYVLNPTSSADGYCYRFANTGTEESPSYEWVLIKDSDVTKALQDIIDINKEITGIKKFDTEISSWKNDTDEELSSLKLRTSTLETDMGTKVESSVFNEVKQTVDENSSSIASLSTTVSKKADGSTVETLTNTVNSVKQTADKNTLSISGMQTEIGKKADGSTVTELSTKTSKLEQNLDGFKTEVSNTYTTKTEFDNIQIGGRNLLLNSNFELPGNPNWIGLSDYAYITKEGRNGGYCAKQIGKLNENHFLINSVSLEVKANDVFTFSGWYKVQDYVSGTTNNFVRPYIEYHKSDFSWAAETAILSISPYATDWTYVQASFKVPNIQEIDYMKFILFARDYTGIIWWDDLKLEKGNKATDWSPAQEDIEQTAKSYTDQKADEITQVVSKKVGADEIISKINQTAEKITIDASKLNLTGYVTIENLKGSGTTEINGANIVTGSIDADKLNVTDLSALNATIGGFDITDSGISKSYTKSGSVSGKEDSYSIEISSNGIPSYKGASYVWEDSSTKSVHEYTFGDYLTINQYINLGGNDIKQQWYRTEIGNTYAGALTISKFDTSGVIEYKTLYGFGHLIHSKYEDGNLSSTAPFDIRSPLKISSNVNASLTNYGLQISSNTGNHMNLGQGTIQAVNKDNDATTLFLNSYGGNVSIGKVGGEEITTLNANVAFEKHCSRVTTSTPNSSKLYGVLMNGGQFVAVVFNDYSISSVNPWASIINTNLMSANSKAKDIVLWHNLVTGRGECVRVAFNPHTGSLAVNAQYNDITNDTLNGIAIFPVLQ